MTTTLMSQPRRPRRLAHPLPESTGRDTRAETRREGLSSDAPEPLRLSKRMAALGLCSRREADEWIAKGWVRVDGKRITELGTKILPQQTISIEPAARAEQQGRMTILLHKPIGYVSAQAEAGYKPAVLLVAEANLWKEDASGIRFRPGHTRGLAPAGRLDIDSTGLLVLTQDGRIARRLIGADSGIEKEYLVRVAGKLTREALQRLNHGLALDGVPLRPAQVSWLNQDQLRFVLNEGRNRQIRRMCELVGLQVLGLKRVRVGNVVLGRLPRGQWRYLRQDEQF